MGSVQVRWVSVPIGRMRRAVPVVGLVGGEVLLRDDVEALWGVGPAGGAWDFVEPAEVVELKALRLVPRGVSHVSVLYKEELGAVRATDAYHALWIAPREPAAAPERRPGTVTRLEVALLSLAVLRRASNFLEVAGDSDMVAIIKRDLLRRFHVPAYDQLPAADLQAARAFVETWTKQMWPLSRKQQAYLAWPASKQARGTYEPMVFDPFSD